MRQLKFLAIALASVMLLAVEVAEAKRLGGGSSFGRQSSSVTQRQATPSQTATAPKQQAQPGTAAGAAQPARNRWLAPLAGIAAGLGLAALASHLGLGEELGSLMLIMLMVFAAFMVYRVIAARRAAQSGPALQGAYPNGNVGSEASVRYAPLPDQPSGSGQPSVVQPAALSAPAAGPWGVPADFDVEGFVRNAKVQFVRLQTAYDSADLNDLRDFTSPEMFAELRLQIHERGAASNRTDVVRLDAELLGVETSAGDHLASVRFHGLVRESESAPAQEFDEVWNLAKPLDGSSGWVLAGIQQLN